MIPNYNAYMFMPPPFLPPNCDKPPTIYTILESIVNPLVDLNEPAPEVKIKDLAKQGRNVIFNFDYPLTENISRETFETMILNKFLMRRINFDTVTAFRIQLGVKLNEIMPLYNKMFDSLENWNIFQDGEITTKTGRDDKTTVNVNNTTNTSTDNTTNNSSNSLSNNSTTGDTQTSDRRYSETPQNNLQDVRDGNYVTQYNYDTNTNSGTDSSTSTGSSQSTTQSTKNDSGTSRTDGTDNTTYTETVTRTPGDKIAIMKEMQTSIQNIYTMIFKDLEILFYGLV